MSTNFFKKVRTFSYVRLFFILIICLFLLGMSFSVYVVSRAQKVEQSKQTSNDFFQKYNTSLLQYNNKRQHYIEQYGQPTSTTINKESKTIVDTYLSDNALKGISIRYQLTSDNQTDAILVGYLISGNEVMMNIEQIDYLKSSKGKTINDVQVKCGVGKILIESEDEGMHRIAYKTSDGIVTLKVENNTNQVIDVEIEKK